MRAVVQRVKQASVTVDARQVGAIGPGLLVFLGVGREDGDEDVRYLADKCAGLRIFEDEAGKMNLSVSDVRGEALVVSQFTLFGDARKGKRPSFIAAARPEKAVPLYEAFVRRLRDRGVPVATGEFQAMMDIALVNDGPVTILLDSRKAF